MSEKLGLKEVVAMGVGGIIGGGIFAVLGVAAQISGNAAFLTYAIAGVIALVSGRSYWHMTEQLREEGGSFTFLEHYVENKNIAGIVGWVLIVGYIGTMAMYAYAFGSFAAGMFGIEAAHFIRGLLSMGIVGVFVAINLAGIDKTGGSENLMVYAKVAILGLFCVAGIYGLLAKPSLELFKSGLFNTGIVSPIVGVGAIFVSFEGFQLLTYEYSEIRDRQQTLRKGIMYSIIISTVIYVFVSLIATNLLTASQIAANKETVLAFAASKIFQTPLLNKASYILVSIAALFSTASAINATLFGTSRLTHKIAEEGELPEIFSFRDKKGIPVQSILIVGAATALFTFLGTLERITTFASVSFTIVFSVVNYLSFKESVHRRNKAIAGLGLIGTLSALVFLILHLYTQNPGMLIFILGLFTALLGLETIYFEREPIEKVAEEIEEDVGEVEEKFKHEIEEL